jgi:hypothetical protein
MKKNRKLLFAGACCFTLLSVFVSRQSLADGNLGNRIETQCMKSGFEVAYACDCSSGSGSCVDNKCPKGSTEKEICF